MKSYTWGYITESILAMMDLTVEEMNQNNLMNKIPFYINKGMSEICSAVKPYNGYVSLYVNSYNTNKVIDISEYTNKVFIGFRGGRNYVTPIKDMSFLNEHIEADGNTISYPINETQEIEEAKQIYLKSTNIETREAHDEDFVQVGYSSIICKKPGYYNIAVKLRWWIFAINEDDKTIIECPEDILDALMILVASELWSLEDEKKSAILRSKYETAVARIDNTDYNNTSTLNIEGGW